MCSMDCGSKKLLINFWDSFLDADAIGIIRWRRSVVKLYVHARIFKYVCPAPAKEIYVSVAKRNVCALTVSSSRHVPKSEIRSRSRSDGIDATNAVVYAVFVFIEKQGSLRCCRSNELAGFVWAARVRRCGVIAISPIAICWSRNIDPIHRAAHGVTSNAR